MDADVAVSNAAWLELLHAEAVWALEQSKIDVLIIKGPSNAEWLYRGEHRASADVDLLVHPGSWAATLNRLSERGFEDRGTGSMHPWERPIHAVSLTRHDTRQGQHSIDLHKMFPGITSAPGTAFEVLWQRRSRGAQAGIAVWYPDVVSRSLLIALHAARDPNSPRTAEDLRRAFSTLDEEQRGELTELARELGAREALRAGLETLPETSKLVSDFGLGEIEISPYWAIRSQGGSGLVRHVDELHGLPAYRWPAAIWAWTFPSPSLMKASDSRASRGPLWLGKAYLARIGKGIRQIPEAVKSRSSDR